MADDLYETEEATFERELPRLLEAHRGRWVLLRGAEIGGVFDERRAAVRAGRRRWGNVPIYVRHITEEEEYETFSFLDCPGGLR